jgi:hypothetical protein
MMESRDEGQAAERDLAATRAGALAREQALAHRSAAPFRTLLARLVGVHTDERAWRIGADGEERVGRQLEVLARKDPRWRFLHAIPVGERGSDIDHLVVGPGGVFTINTKNHPGGKVWVGGDVVLINGRRQPYIRNSRFEANRASSALTAAAGQPVNVRAVVVLVGAPDLTVKTAPADVAVLYRGGLVRWLRRQPESLDDAAIRAVFEAARRPSTWR